MIAEEKRKKSFGLFLIVWAEQTVSLKRDFTRAAGMQQTSAAIESIAAPIIAVPTPNR